MTTLDEAYSAIVARAEAIWPAIEPTVPLATLNAGFQRDPAGNSWILLRVDWSGGEQTTIGAPGANRARRDGNLWLDAFVPIGAGAEEPMRLACKAARIFEGQDFAGVTCHAMEPGAGTSGSDDGLYFGESVNVPFYFYEEI